MAENQCLWGIAPPFGGITRIRFKGFVYDVSAIRLPRTNFFKLRPGPGMSTSAVLAVLSSSTEFKIDSNALHANFQLQATSFYFSAFTLVWKIASHSPFSSFQTEPAL